MDRRVERRTFIRDHQSGYLLPGMIISVMIILNPVCPVSAETTVEPAVFIEKYIVTPSVLVPGDPGTSTKPTG